MQFAVSKTADSREITSPHSVSQGVIFALAMADVPCQLQAFKMAAQFAAMSAVTG